MIPLHNDGENMPGRDVAQADEYDWPEELPDQDDHLLNFMFNDIGAPLVSEGASSMLHAPEFRHLDDSEDSMVEITHPTAGKVFHRQAKNQSDYTANLFQPFFTELDWSVAHWAIKDNPGKSAFNRLLSIPGVSDSTIDGT
jgi:hypothetical protein